MKTKLTTILLILICFASFGQKIQHRQIEPYTAFEIVGLNDFIQDSMLVDTIKVTGLLQFVENHSGSPDLSNYAILNGTNTFTDNQIIYTTTGALILRTDNAGGNNYIYFK